MLLTALTATLLLAPPAQTIHAPHGEAVPAAAPAQERGWMGVRLEAREDVAGDPRVVVASVAPDSPASAAGLAADDVLLAIAGSPIGGLDDLSGALGNTRPGQRVSVEVLRRFEVPLAAREGSDRGWLGVSIDDGREIEMLGEGGRAVRVVRVTEGSPAEAAGLLAGDQIVAVDGDVAAGPDSLIETIGARPAGDRVRLAVSREVPVTLGRNPDAAASPAPPAEALEPREPREPRQAREPREPRAPREPREPRAPREPREPRAPEAPRGYLGVYLEGGAEARVGGAVEGGPAAAAGLLAGDVIVGVDGREVSSVSDLTETLRGTDPGQEVVLSVRRGESVEQVEVTLGEAGVFGATPGAPANRFFGPGGAELDDELRARMESALEEWQAAQRSFGKRWSSLMEEARERGQGTFGWEALGQQPGGGTYSFRPGATTLWLDAAREERESLREEMRGLREELRGLREELAAMKEALGR